MKQKSKFSLIKFADNVVKNRCTMEIHLSRVDQMMLQSLQMLEEQGTNFDEHFAVQFMKLTTER